MKKLIVLHGLQGSGKSTYSAALFDKFDKKYTTTFINFKHSFDKMGDTLIKQIQAEIKFASDLSHIEFTERHTKQAYLAISTYGEQIVDKNLWSFIYLAKLRRSLAEVVFTDDCRVKQNIDTLMKFAEENPKTEVYLFKLSASEEIRKKRCGDTWRDNGGYTEMLQDKPENLPKNFKWIEVDSEQDSAKATEFILNSL